MLNKMELARYSPGLTTIFIDRVFEELQTFEGEMDYKTFLDFVLAMENKKTPQSLHYFWRILDVFHKGDASRVFLAPPEGLLEFLPSPNHT